MFREPSWSGGGRFLRVSMEPWARFPDSAGRDPMAFSCWGQRGNVATTSFPILFSWILLFSKSEGLIGEENGASTRAMGLSQ